MFELTVHFSLPNGRCGYLDHEITTAQELQEALDDIANWFPDSFADYVERKDCVASISMELREFKGIAPHLIDAPDHVNTRELGWYVSLSDCVGDKLDKTSGQELSALLDDLIDPFVDSYNIYKLLESIRWDKYDRLITKKIRQLKELSKRVKGIDVSKDIERLEAFVEKRKERYQARATDLFGLKEELFNKQMQLGDAIKLIEKELAGRD